MFQPVFVSGVLVVCAIAAAGDAPTDGLAVARSPEGKAYLTYKGEPLFAFGPGDEMRILSGAADVKRWAAWQQGHGMNLLRAYPVSVPLSMYGAEGLDPFQRRGEKWDVDAWNEAYFEHLRNVAAVLEEHDIILHLQLWQITFFKSGPTRWDANYLNPKNNVNEWTRTLDRGRDYIDAPEGSPARRHQQEWVRRVLDAVKGRGNVWIDIINELGNEMGTLPWARETALYVRTLEKEQGRTWLVGVDSEHHYRPDLFGPFADSFDLIILNELRSPTHARTAIAAFNKPAVSVRSSDGSNRYEDYVFARPDQTGPEHQTRYRTLCYRSLFSGLQAVGAYWKPEVHDADYQTMASWPRYAQALRRFWKAVASEWPRLEVDDAIVASDTVTPHACGLRSNRIHLVYLDCGPRAWNTAYPASELVVTCPFRSYRVSLFNPRNGEFTSVEASRETNGIHVPLPEFMEDHVILIEKRD